MKLVILVKKKTGFIQFHTTVHNIYTSVVQPINSLRPYWPRQEGLNIWRGKLFQFFQILYNHIYPKVIVISIVDLQKTNNFAKFGGYCSKNAPATPLRSLEWSRAWQAYFLRYHFRIWQKVDILWVQKVVKISCWYLKASLKNSNFTILSFQFCPHEVKI